MVRKHERGRWDALYFLKLQIPRRRKKKVSRPFAISYSLIPVLLGIIPRFFTISHIWPRGIESNPMQRNFAKHHSCGILFHEKLAIFLIMLMGKITFSLSLFLYFFSLFFLVLYLIGNVAKKP